MFSWILALDITRLFFFVVVVVTKICSWKMQLAPLTFVCDWLFCWWVANFHSDVTQLTSRCETSRWCTFTGGLVCGREWVVWAVTPRPSSVDIKYQCSPWMFTSSTDRGRVLLTPCILLKPSHSKCLPVYICSLPPVSAPRLSPWTPSSPTDEVTHNIYDCLRQVKGHLNVWLHWAQWASYSLRKPTWPVAACD